MKLWEHFFLTLLKMSGYVKTFKEKNDKLMSLRMNDGKLLKNV